MFTEASLETPDKKLSKKQKAHRTKSMVELDKLIRELEKIQMTTPLMFVDQEASMNPVEGNNFSVDGLSQEMEKSPPQHASPTNHDSLAETSESPPLLSKKYEIPEPKFEHHYLVPTVSSSLPIYLQGETERIRSSFRSHTCWTIKKLPNTLMTGEVQRIRRQHAVENLVSTSSNAFKPASLLKARDFDQPEYIGTDFDKMKNLNKIQVEQEKIRIDSYSRRPFVVSSRIRAKFEDIFNDDSYQFAYMGPGGNVVKLDAITRGSGAGRRPGSAGDGTTSAGPAAGVPPKNGGKYDADLLMIKSWVTKIHQQISRDWPMYSFRIRYTPTQEILIQFAYPKANGMGASTTADGAGIIPPFPPPHNALNKYMHQLASHGLASQFNLAKRGDRWHVVERDWADSASTVTSAQRPGDGDAGIFPNEAQGSLDGRDTNNSSLTSSGSQPTGSGSGNRSRGAEALSSGQTGVASSTADAGRETVVLTEGGLLEEDPDGQRWFRPLPHYRHHEEPVAPSLEASAPSSGAVDGDTAPAQPPLKTAISPEPSGADEEAPPTGLSRMKKSVSFSKLDQEATTDSSATTADSETTASSTAPTLRPFQANASASSTANGTTTSSDSSGKNLLLRRRLSSSMPQLETMLEETSSQLSSKATLSAHGNGDVSRSLDEGSAIQAGEKLQFYGTEGDAGKYTDYLTFSFYTPWVSCRQANTSKYYAQQNRYLAREKLRAREEKQTKLLAQLDAAIAEEKAKAQRRPHGHNAHHNQSHAHISVPHGREASLPPGIGAAHAYYGSITPMPNSSFSLTDTFLSGLNRDGGAHGANAAAAGHGWLSGSSSAASSVHPPHHLLSRQASSSSNVSSVVGSGLHQPQPSPHRRML